MTIFSDIVIASPATVIFPPGTPGRQTICVLGAARGGTSLVAGCLRRLGVFIGETVDASTGEDQAFMGHRGERDLFLRAENRERREAYLRDIRAVIAARDAEHAVWGWKDPLASFYVREIADELLAPVFIVVTRDVGAIAGREHLQEFHDIAGRFLAYGGAALEQYRDIFEFVGAARRPALVVSYERSLRAPREFGLSLADFVGVRPDEEFGAWLDGFVAPDRGSGEETAPQTSFFRAGLLGRSVEARTLLAESVRIGREAALASPETRQDGAVLQACVEALHGGDGNQARALGLALWQAQLRDYPHLADGILGALSVSLIGVPEIAVLPDMACGALYLLGLANLQLIELQTALAYLVAAEAAMRVRLLGKLSGSAVSRANYWAAMFHIGWLARVLGREDLTARVKADFARADAGDAYFTAFSDANFAELLRRVRLELA